MFTGALGASVCVFVSVALIDPVFGQSKISGAPSNARPRVTGVTERADEIADQIGVAAENVQLLADFLRMNKVDNRLGDYLSSIGASPKPGEAHIFYVTFLTGENGLIELNDFQYLTYGNSTEDALRESFTLIHAPGSEARLYATPNGTKLAGTYIVASPEGGKYVFKYQTLSKEYYQKIRQEGLALRDRRNEAARIEKIRKDRVAVHAAGDARAREQLKRALARGDLPPGPALFPPEPPQGSFPPVYFPPAVSTSTGTTVQTSAPPPEAHPPVKFDLPPPPTNKGVTVNGPG